jgi:hypothetical protein
MGVKFGKLKKKNKKDYWLCKWAFGGGQQEHLEEKKVEMK